MANTRSAAKQARVSVRRRAINVAVTKTVKTSVKTIRNLVKAGKKDEASKLLTKFQSEIDRAAKKGVIHKNQASRQKSRITALLKAAK
jgi:small subunit ribosomal protein S20